MLLPTASPRSVSIGSTKNGTIFNSVATYILQATRTKRSVKRNELDMLTEVWVGPSGHEDSWIGLVGHKHHDYNVMTVISSDVRRLPGLVSEVTVTYQGKLANVSGGTYVSPPTLDKYWQEGEVSFMSGSPARTINRRYTGYCVDVSYITNKVPSGKPTGIGTHNHYLGFENIFDIQMGVQQGISASGGVIQQMCCTNVNIHDRGDGWYEVKETYQSRMFPYGGGTSSGSGAGGGTWTAGNTSPIFKTDTYALAYSQLMYNMNKAAQDAWTAGGGVGPAPADNSPYGQQTQQLTGVNPGWTADMQMAAGAAANGGGSSGGGFF